MSSNLSCNTLANNSSSGGFLGGFVIAFVCYIGIRVQGARVNKRRLANKSGEETDISLDLTDKEDENFIYRL